MASHSRTLLPEELNLLNLYLRSRQSSVSQFSKSENDQIRYFTSKVQQDKGLQDAIAEHLMANHMPSPDDTSSDVNEGPSSNRPSVVFMSPPPSTIGRGEQFLSPTFIASRKFDTYQEFTTAQAQQAQAQAQIHHTSAPTTSNGGVIPYPPDFPRMPTHVPSPIPATVPPGVTTSDNNNNNNDDDHDHDGDHDDHDGDHDVEDGDEDDDDDKKIPRTAEEALDVIQRATDKWAFHMKASVLAEAEVSRASLFFLKLGRTTQRPISPEKPLPVSVPLYHGHAEDLIGFGSNWSHPQPATPPFHVTTITNNNTKNNNNMPGMSMNQRQQHHHHQQRSSAFSVSTARPDTIFSGMNQQERSEAIWDLGIRNSRRL